MSSPTGDRSWEIEFDEEFHREFVRLSIEVQDQLLGHAGLLQRFGPTLGRPTVDTLNGSKHRNMKELRFDAANGAWRVAFAFDPRRRAILLVAGDKSGHAEKAFYKKLITAADIRYGRHMETLAAGDEVRSNAQTKGAAKHRKSKR